MEKLRMLQKEDTKECVTVLKTGMTIFVLSIIHSIPFIICFYTSLLFLIWIISH